MTQLALHHLAPRPDGRALVLAVAACLALLPGKARSTFVVSPMEHHLQIAAGDRQSALVSVRNTGERPLTIRLYFNDSRFGQDGREEDLPPGALGRSCAPWILLETQILELQPGGVRQFSLRLSAPPEAKGSYWTKLYLEEMSTPEPLKKRVEGRSYQVFMRQRMGVRIFEDVIGTSTRDAAVRRVAVGAEKEGRVITTRVENAGNSLLRCQGRLELRDERGETLETLEFGSGGEFLLFPETSRDLVVKTREALAPGTYTALAVVDFGGDHLVAGEEIFRVEGRQP